MILTDPQLDLGTLHSVQTHIVATHMHDQCNTDCMSGMTNMATMRTSEVTCNVQRTTHKWEVHYKKILIQQYNGCVKLQITRQDGSFLCVLLETPFRQHKVNPVFIHAMSVTQFRCPPAECSHTSRKMVDKVERLWLARQHRGLCPYYSYW
jgi:hypothetical protein